MKRRYLSAIVLLVLLLGSGSYILVRSSGKIAAAPAVRPLSDAPWSADERATDDDGTVAQYAPDIAVDPMGSAFAVWLDLRGVYPPTLYVDVYFAYRPAGGSWGSNVRVNDDQAPAFLWSAPRIAVDHAGNAYAVWGPSPNTRDIYFSFRPTGGAWGPSIRINDDTGTATQDSPAIAVDMAGNAYAVWRDMRNGDQGDIYFSSRAVGGNWESNVRVNDDIGGATQADPSIAVDASGNAYAVWRDDRGGTPSIYFAYRPAGGNWGLNITVSEPGTGGSEPSIGLDQLGNAYALWYSNFNIYFAYRPAGGDWGPSIRVNQTSTRFGPASPEIAVDPTGNAHAVWLHYDDVHVDAYSAYRPAGGNWGEEYRVNDMPNGVGLGPPRPRVAVAVDSAGQAYSVWQDGRNDRYDIYFSYRPAGGPTPTDIGFRPDPDGYRFSNSDSGWGSYPLPPADGDYMTADMRRMFGDAAVCRMVGSVCFVKPTALKWNVRVNWDMNRGHCDGFTTTSLRFFKGLDNPVDFQGGANSTHDLQLGNARRHIAYYWVLQVPNPVAAARSQGLQKTPSQVLDQLHSAMSDGASDPTTLLVYNTARTAGHSITPYAIEDRGDGVYWVRVYDNNHPDDNNRHVEISTTNDTWNYNLGWTTWSGDANTHTLGIVPISKYAEQPLCPWCSGTSASTLNGSPSSQVWLAGEGHLLITDSQGRRIGYAGDQFVNEVPGAFGSVPPGGLGIPAEPIYTLPLTETYIILLDGQILTQTETVAVTQFGPGYAVSVEDVTLEPASQDQLIIAPDGTQLAYQSDDDEEATLTLALDSAGESLELQVQGADIGASQVVTLTAELSEGQLVFDNSQGSGGTYDLEVARISDTGQQWFVHVGLDISATDTHYADYDTWDGSGPMTLYIDHSSDGTIDETLVLDNQAPRIYLPLIFKDY